MTWEQKPLSAILTPSGKERAGGREFPVLSITMKHGLIDQREKFKKRVASKDTRTYRVVKENELVVGFPIDEGVLGFQTKYPAGIVSPAYDIWKLRDSKKSYIPYLERFLRSTRARHLYASKMQGAVARRRSLKKDDFLALKIPFPPVKEQMRIAVLLKRIESIIDVRKINLKQLDEFIKSIFFEMFGDPIKNNKEWPTKNCSKVVPNIVSGTSYGGDDRNVLYDDEMGVLKISAVTEGYFKSTEFKAVNKKNIKKKVLTVRKGDFLLSRANTRELVAACCVVDKDYPKLFLPDKLWKLSFDEKLINPQYFNFLLKNETFRNKVRKLATGGHQSMLNISMKKFWTLDIVVPDKILQDDFEKIVEKVEILKYKYKQSLTGFENLYGILSQKAFKGMLDLSRIPLPEVIEPEVHERNLVDQIAVTDEVRIVEYPMSVPDERTRLLRSYFDEYLKQCTGYNLSLDDFWQEASLKAVDLMDEFDKSWGTDDYDQVKEWLFDLVREGKLEQSFVMSTDSPPDGQIELKIKG